MQVSVFGVGYVGLVQAAVLAEVGNQVVCVDISQPLVDRLSRGEVSIYEPGLEALLKKNLAENRISFTTNIADGVAHGEVIFIAVGTPPDEDGSADLQYVLAVAASIGTFMTNEKIVVNKSTVPVGTANKVKNAINAVLSQRGCSIPFEVVSNPEFLKEGSAVNDCMRPDRVILGLDQANGNAADVLKELYAPFSRNHEKLMIMDVKSAELTKYAANCMLATKISFMNEMANLAELVGADIEMVRQGIGSDPRIGYQFIYPGCGYGGSCLPKDVKALIRAGRENDYPLSILQAVDTVNEQQKHNLYRYLLDAFDGDIAGKTVAVWGLAFKPNTTDMREASSRVLLPQLWAQNIMVQAYDPKASEDAQIVFGQHPLLRLMGTKEAALMGADALIICTEWQQFRSPDFVLIKNHLAHPVIIDGRNLYDPKRMKHRGFKYYAVGRGESLKIKNDN